MLWYATLVSQEMALVFRWVVLVEVEVAVPWAGGALSCAHLTPLRSSQTLESDVRFALV